MKKIYVYSVITVLLLINMVAAGEELKLEDTLQELAQLNAMYLSQVLGNDDYLTNYVVGDIDACKELLVDLCGIDYLSPEHIILFIPKEEWSFDPSTRFIGDDLDMNSISPEAIISYTARLPIEAARYGEPSYYKLSQSTAIEGAYICEGLNGIAYILQYFGEDSPLVVSAIATVEYPAAISYTSFLYNKGQMQNTLTILCSQIDRTYGEKYDPIKVK